MVFMLERFVERDCRDVQRERDCRDVHVERDCRDVHGRACPAGPSACNPRDLRACHPGYCADAHVTKHAMHVTPAV